MDRLIAIGEASKALGVSITTLRRWEAEGKLIPERTVAGHRRYDLAKLKPEIFHNDAAEWRTVAYARVSSHDQKDDLERQKQVLELYCARQGWTFEVIADLGSGMNYRKKGLKRLLNDVVEGRIGRLVITHKDRLLRFGAELVFAICAAKNVEVVILNQGEDTTFEEDLAKDVLEEPFHEAIPLAGIVAGDVLEVGTQEDQAAGAALALGGGDAGLGALDLAFEGCLS